MDPNQFSPGQTYQPQPVNGVGSEPDFLDRPPVPFDHHLPLHGTPDQVAPQPVFQQPAQPLPRPAPEPVYRPAEPIFAVPEPTKAVSNQLTQNAVDDRPVPVVKVLSVRGVEYAMMSILLWFWSASLITILVSLIMGGTGFAELAFPVSLMIVTVPAFAFFYIRLRKAELRDPGLRLEASKRRFSQITQILAFLTCLFNLIALVYILMSAASGESTTSLPKFIGATVVTLMVAGGILAYYWLDEHKLVK